jgi:hypothetical protein
MLISPSYAVAIAGESARPHGLRRHTARPTSNYSSRWPPANKRKSGISCTVPVPAGPSCAPARQGGLSPASARISLRLGRLRNEWWAAGLENPAGLPANPQVSETGGAESRASGAVFGPSAPISEPAADPDLVLVTRDWPTLPESVKAQIVATGKVLA